MDSTRSAIAEFLSSFASNRGRLEVREHRREKFLAMGAQLG
jgi:acetyl-CoA carboxylase carboxyl transferase subunit alpha